MPNNESETGWWGKTTQRGAASEFLAIAKLIELGHDVALPVVDRGVDLVIDYRIKAQVKRGGVQANSDGRGASFRLHNNRTSGEYTVEPDVYLFHAHAWDVWWIIPTSELREAGALNRSWIQLRQNPVYRSKYSRLDQYRGAWATLADL